jgi:hypothetical protein
MAGEMKQAGTRDDRAGRSVHRKLAAAAVLAAGLMLGSQKHVKADSIEVMAGNKNAVVDLKASAPLTDRLGAFIRARPSVDYKGALDSFALADLTINLKGGLDAVAEVQAFGGTAVPRAGVQHFVSRGAFSLYSLATIGTDKSPYLEMLASLEFSPAIYKALCLIAKAEVVTDTGSGGHVFSRQSPRLGLGLNGWSAGAAADLAEIGNHPKSGDGTFSWNVGGFIAKKF